MSSQFDPDERLKQALHIEQQTAAIKVSDPHIRIEASEEQGREVENRFPRASKSIKAELFFDIAS